MAGELGLKKGSKIMMAYDVRLGMEPKFELMCSFVCDIDTSVFKVSRPMNPDGTPVPLNENQKFLLVYGSGPVKSIIAGYAEDEEKDGINTYWLVRRVTEQRQFFKRVDERVKAQFNIEYTCDAFPELSDGTTQREDAYTIDISFNGAAIYLNDKFDVGYEVEVFMPGFGSGIGSDPINYLKAVVCWNREAPKESKHKLICGLQYRFDDEIQKERMKLYVSHIKRVFDVN